MATGGWGVSSVIGTEQAAARKRAVTAGLRIGYFWCSDAENSNPDRKTHAFAKHEQSMPMEELGSCACLMAPGPASHRSVRGPDERVACCLLQEDLRTFLGCLERCCSSARSGIRAGAIFRAVTRSSSPRPNQHEGRSGQTRSRKRHNRSMRRKRQGGHSSWRLSPSNVSSGR